MESRLSQEQKRRAEVYGIIAYYKTRTMRASLVYWLLMIIGGVVGTVLWNWLAIPAAILLGMVLGGFTSHRTSKIIQSRTGMSIEEQWKAWKDPTWVLEEDEFLRSHGLGMGERFRERGKVLISEEYEEVTDALSALGWTKKWLNYYELSSKDFIGAFGRTGFFSTPREVVLYGLDQPYWFLQRKKSNKNDWDWEFGSWVAVARHFYESMPLTKRLLRKIAFLGSGWKKDIFKK